MKIAPEAWPYVYFGLAGDAAGAGAAVCGVYSHSRAWLAAGVLVCVLAGLFIAFCFYFFRDPERPEPADAGKLYSPGDGVVLSVAREGKGEEVTLRIFLSVFDVHVQRVPCAGTVESVEHIPGSLVMAMKDEAKANERVVMRVKPEGGRAPLVVEQIAGLVARRIVCRVKPGDRLKIGERYGVIHFGSQAAVHFPLSARCTVKPGDRLFGGLTPIGEWIG